MPDETKAPPESEVEFAWKQICELRASEQHFNEIKAKCRALASTWLLAAFGAVGFLASQNLSINLPVQVVIFGLGLAASTGLLLLWILDLLVYHRLLDASFVEALKLERKYPSLPQVRQNMVASQPGGQTTNYQAWFYVVAISAPLAFSGAVFSHWCMRFGFWGSAVATVGILSLIVATGRFVWIKSPNPALRATPAERRG